MPHALTDRQREVLEYIRNFIQENESSPRLEEISQHFGIKAPTAHKMLEALRNKGYLYFGRNKATGFFIRLIERARIYLGYAKAQVNRLGVINFIGKLTANSCRDNLLPIL